MRAALIAAVAAAGLGIAGLSAGLAAPVNGIVIGNAAGTGAIVDHVRWYHFHHHHHHFFFHHHHHHRWRW
jgi:hypothetical protein